MRIKEIVCLFMSFLNSYTIRGDTEKLSLRMPGVRPKKVCEFSTVYCCNVMYFLIVLYSICSLDWKAVCLCKAEF
jgi:hypothetical protein